MQIKDSGFTVTGASSDCRQRSRFLIAVRKWHCSLAATILLRDLAEKLPGSFSVTADMTQFDMVREAVRTIHQHYGRVDGLVNNAGRSYAAAVEEIDPKSFDEILHLNVVGPIVAMQAVIPLMRAQGGGSIVNINSGTRHRCGQEPRRKCVWTPRMWK